jgi:AraC family transcriptional regulator, regulatory protein of adaptative response / methylated-DNA-[protein]-cysteine methyltransferase
MIYLVKNPPAAAPAKASLRAGLDPDLCWDAVVRRDASWDGRMVMGVLTTGIYCRPTCPARRPLRKNVRFYATTEEARRDGLRACKRCKPDGAAETIPPWVAAACAYIRRECDGGESLTLEALGAKFGVSPAHLQRTFRAAVGVSPRQFAERCRMDRLKTELREGSSVTGAIYAAGFGSSSRVYERAPGQLGMTPGEYGSGGKGVTITYAATDTALGPLLIAATDRGLCAVELGGSVEDLVTRLDKEYPNAELVPTGSRPSPELAAWIEALRAHVEEGRPHGELPLDVRATAFQRRVWAFLQSIPAGETRTYAEVAKAIGAPGSSRAVARACASNPAALAIPCHRVIRADGALAGYRWGAERKAKLLERERERARATG